MDDFDDDLGDLRAEVYYQRRHQAELLSNPDCRDPDHPSCELCDDEDDHDDE